VLGMRVLRKAVSRWLMNSGQWRTFQIALWFLFFFYPLFFPWNFSAIHANSLDWLKRASGRRQPTAGLDEGELIGRILEVS
jgi:hypothetical protein